MSPVECTRSTTLRGTPAQVWALLAALDRIDAWADGVDHSCYTTRTIEGVGAARRVQVGRMALLETVTVWEPEAALAYTIDGLPPLVRSVTNHWHLEPAAAGTRVSLTTTIDPGPTLRGRIGARVLRLPLGRASAKMLHGLGEWPWRGPRAQSAPAAAPAADAAADAGGSQG